MSCSKPLPPFTYDLLYYLNRDQLERFSIICRPLKNFIERYFHSKPYRIFDFLLIRAGMYALAHNVQLNEVQWHPNRDNYSVQQFLAGQTCNTDSSLKGYAYYSFAEMLPCLGPTVRIKKTYISVAGGSTYNPEHIEQMESISYLWHDGDIYIWHANRLHGKTVAEDFQLILKSPTILQCRKLYMYNAHFAFKDYKIFYSVNFIEIFYYNEEEKIDSKAWSQFLEQPGVKPVVAMHYFGRKNIHKLLNRLFKDFSSAVSPNALKIVFIQCKKVLIEFREVNQTSAEIFELKKGLPAEYQKKYLENCDNYTLERYSI